jgi:uncharacterized membrane protein
MRTEKARLHIPLRLRALLGATLVVAVLWFITVLAVRVFVSTPPLGDQSGRLGNVGRVAIGRKHGGQFFSLRQSFGNAFDLSAWHKVAMVLIVVTLTALAVAIIDRLRRTSRRSRHARTV